MILHKNVSLALLGEYFLRLTEGKKYGHMGI